MASCTNENDCFVDEPLVAFLAFWEIAFQEMLEDCSMDRGRF
jgi:hypothetical protein